MRRVSLQLTIQDNILRDSVNQLGRAKRRPSSHRIKQLPPDFIRTRSFPSALTGNESNLIDQDLRVGCGDNRERRDWEGGRGGGDRRELFLYPSITSTCSCEVFERGLAQAEHIRTQKKANSRLERPGAFGPEESRFGRSKSVDLSPSKNCLVETGRARSRLVLLILVPLVQDRSTRSVLRAKCSFRTQVDTILESHKP